MQLAHADLGLQLLAMWRHEDDYTRYFVVNAHLPLHLPP
jgi:hypothetical protein